MESRVEQAVATFESGYTCAQSVFVTYADLFGMDRQSALKLASPMGGGVGRMREICGVVSAMALLAGLKEGNTDPENEEGKERIYLLVREMADQFKEKNNSIICRELLGLDHPSDSPTPSARTPEYYKKRPCEQVIGIAAAIMEKYVEEHPLQENPA